MARMVKSDLPGNLGSTLLIKLRRANPELAKQCLDATLKMIQTQQNLLLQPYLRALKTRISGLEGRMHQVQSDLAILEKRQSFQIAYFARRDEYRHLIQQLEESQLALLRVTQARLNSDIYVGTNPVSPSLILTLVLGTLIGLVIGFLLAIGGKLFARVHREA